MSGVAEIHRNYFLHLDLKPENVVISINKNGKIKSHIIDFGFSMERNLKEIRKNVPIHESYAISDQKFGTPIYLAPEIFNWKEKLIKYDAKVDSFALGVILYQIMSQNNYNPFDLSSYSFRTSKIFTLKGPIIKEIA